MWTKRISAAWLKVGAENLGPTHIRYRRLHGVDPQITVTDPLWLGFTACQSETLFKRFTGVVSAIEEDGSSPMSINKPGCFDALYAAIRCVQ